MLTVCLAGGSCSGKTTLARRLKDVLPLTVLLHQDSYYRSEGDSNHVRHSGLNCINWEVLQSFQMDSLVEDARTAIWTASKSSPRHSPCPALPFLPPSTPAQLQRVRHLPLLVLEGICVLNDPRVAAMSHLKFFLEVEKEECRSRREERAVWGGPQRKGEEMWPESAEYFMEVSLD